jgi:hypothetical protein
VIVPTFEQIQRGAYLRWERRGRGHGHDCEDWFAAESELAFRLNYRMVVEYSLCAREKRILGDQTARKCRFCERTSRHAAFGPPGPIVPPAFGETSLWTAALCDECSAWRRESCDEPLARGWRTLRQEYSLHRWGSSLLSGRALPWDLFKPLVAMALLIMPDAELEYFLDAIEWVNNSDPHADASLFAAIHRRVYRDDSARGQGLISLTIRRDGRAALPYMLFFLGWDGIVAALQVPLCTRDQDLDGRCVPMPRVSSVTPDLQ